MRDIKSKMIISRFAIQFWMISNRPDGNLDPFSIWFISDKILLFFYKFY